MDMVWWCGLGVLVGCCLVGCRLLACDSCCPFPLLLLSVLFPCISIPYLSYTPQMTTNNNTTATTNRLDSSSVGDSTMNAAFLNEGLSDSVHSWEVQLVLEFCDKGSLRNLLNKQGPFQAAGACGSCQLCVCVCLAKHLAKCVGGVEAVLCLWALTGRLCRQNL